MVFHGSNEQSETTGFPSSAIQSEDEASTSNAREVDMMQVGQQTDIEHPKETTSSTTSYNEGSTSNDEEMGELEKSDREQLDTTASSTASYNEGSTSSDEEMRELETSDREQLDTTAEEPISASKSLSSKVSHRGGVINIGGCVITFPNGSFDDITRVDVKLEIDSSKWPPGYIGISPMLYLTADRTLLKPVSVQMTSWCMSDGSEESKNTEVDVLHLPDGSTEWEVITTLPLLDKTVFQFETTDFSPILFGLPERFFGPQYYMLEFFLFATPRNNFTIKFCMKSDLISSIINEAIQGSGAVLQLAPYTIPVQPDDRIQANIACKDNNTGFKFEPNDQFYFLVDKDFIKLEQDAVFSFILTSENRKSQRIALRCDIAKNIDFVHRNLLFNYDWKDRVENRGISTVTNINQSAVSFGETAGAAVLGNPNQIDEESSTKPSMENQSKESVRAFAYARGGEVSANIQQSVLSIGDHGTATLHLTNEPEKRDKRRRSI